MKSPAKHPDLASEAVLQLDVARLGPWKRLAPEVSSDGTGPIPQARLPCSIQSSKG